MIRTQIRLREAQYRALKEIAEHQGDSLAEVIRRAVAQFLETEERRRRALAIAGRFRSGQSDISERHDDY
ncbi:MAG: ribbon-helix-helix protein, CopG family, partial [Anaerolineae bacterium]|nr:ribbon-helix-helix protein, CopG family [Anaerolineae bacterium]